LASGRRIEQRQTVQASSCVLIFQIPINNRQPGMRAVTALVWVELDELQQVASLPSSPFPS
jgi:hypothetical protein